MDGGLFETYSSTNRRNLETPSSVAKPTGQVFLTDTGFFAVMQTTATERYQYFGMTEAAAITCASEIEALSNATVTYKADGSPQGDSPMWNVAVTKVTVTISFAALTTTTTTAP